MKRNIVSVLEPDTKSKNSYYNLNPEIFKKTVKNIMEIENVTDNIKSDDENNVFHKIRANYYNVSLPITLIKVLIWTILI